MLEHWFLNTPEGLYSLEAIFSLLLALALARVSAKRRTARKTPHVEPLITAAVDLTSGLQKTRGEFLQRLKGLVAKQPKLDNSFLSELEQILIESDIGIKTTALLLEELRQQPEGGQPITGDVLVLKLKDAILRILSVGENAPIIPQKIEGKPKIICVVGVNGVGKTTSIGKLASNFILQGSRVLIGACDTFRAAAVEQMEVWAKRAGASLQRGPEGAKPGTVAYETVQRGLKEGFDTILLDTAGRLHTRSNLMNELASVIQIVAKELPGAPHETVLVLDASTGQNALHQAREFAARVPVTGIILTKLDGTAKGGIVVAVAKELGIPVRYVGVGEGVNDLKPFSPVDFVDALFVPGDQEKTVSESEVLEMKKAVRKRR